ncbi:hypothetical protein BBJ28_00006018 [Nothophytophthora sp. Chile5]|nr:hypothetical protein BBJ28_00006018 [Nothophytophthora sp. Chile5]
MGVSAPRPLAAAVFLLALGSSVTTHALVDIPAQLYALYQQDASQFESIAGYLPTELPTILTGRLNGADFTTLPTALQLALLWDSGLVFSGSYDRLVQVQTACGQPMSDAFPRTDAVEAAGCSLIVCNAQIVNFVAPNCSVADMLSQVRCAIDQETEDAAETLPTISDTTFWSEDGAIDADSTVQVFRFNSSATSDNSSSSASSSSSIAFSTSGSSSSNTTTTLLYTINEKPSLRMTDLASCPNQATFVIPCRGLTVDTDSVTRGAWCTPKSGELVDLWLAQELADGTTESSSASRWSHLAIVFISLFGAVALLLAAGLVIYLWRKRPQKASLDGGVCTPPPQTPAPRYTFLGLGRQSSTAGRLPQTTAAAMTSTSADIQHINANLCSQSAELRAFCEDKELLVKKISYRTLRFGELIAKGANGEVWCGEYAQQKVAIKRLLEEMRGDLRCLEYFSKEIRLASSLEHPNIVRFVGVSWRSLTELCMISEYLPHGDLAHYLATPRSRDLTWKQEKISLAVGIGNALVYLHSLAPVIIHRDLKSLNVLLGEDFEAKLSDFGLSRERTFEETMTSGVGTLLWTAPEILRGDRYSEKADIYSFGVVLSELDTCLPPYKLNEEFARGGRNKHVELLPMIRNGQITPRFRPSVPPGILALAQLCLDQDPNKRPNAMQIVYILQSKVTPTL